MTTELAENTTQPKTKKIDKREAIIEAAIELFTTQGYETTTMAEVAKKAAVAVGTVYLYFKNKPDLLMGVKGDYEMDFVSYMARPEIQQIPHHLRARPLIEASFELCERNVSNVQLMGLQPQMIGDIKDKNGGPIQQAIQQFFEEAIAVGAFRPVDSQVAAVITFGMVHTALHQCFEIELGKNKERYINVLVDVMETWLVRPELLNK